jgi:hypothetical protein
MALKKTIQSKGIVIADAYIRIWKIECDKHSMSVTTSVHATADQQGFSHNTHIFPINHDGDVLFVQAYKNLKTTSEYSDAKDC